MNKLIPAILASTVLVAGIFAFMPVQKASTIHSTITQNLERPITLTIDSGATALNDIPLIDSGATGQEFRGRIAAHILDTTQAAGAADVELGCLLFANTANLGGADTASDSILVDVNVIDDANEATETDIANADNCEIVIADVAANTEVVITIEVESIV